MKPLLAAICQDLTKVKYPVLCSPKLDGVRGLVYQNSLSSRSLKPIPNLYTRKYLSKPEFNGLDGELVVTNGDPTNMSPEVFRRTTSGIMSIHGEPDFTFFVFDSFLEQGTCFQQRLNNLKNRVITLNNPRVMLVEHTIANSPEDVLVLEEDYLEKGYEGLMLRSLKGDYKFGRSTVNEGILLKCVRKEVGEAVIISFEEEMENLNEAITNAVGRTERSTSKENLKGKETLGSIQVKDIKTGVTFNVGTGFSAVERKEIWSKKDSLIGNLISYEHRSYKEGLVPRFPTFKGFRHKDDL